MNTNSRPTRQKTSHASLKSITIDIDPELVFYIVAFLSVQDSHNMCIAVSRQLFLQKDTANFAPESNCLARELYMTRGVLEGFIKTIHNLQPQVFTTMGTAAQSFPKGSILLSGMCVLVKTECCKMPKFSLCMQ